MRRVWYCIVLAVAAAVLSACSTADFKKPIADFKQATNDAATGFTTLADALDKEAYEQNVANVVDGKAVTIPKCDTAAKCYLLVSLDDPSKGPTGRMIPLKPSIVANSRKLIASIVTYTKTLDAIASSDDAAQIKTAADAIPGAVSGLAGAVDSLNGAMKRPTDFKSTVTAVTTPAADILTIGLTKYAEYEKLNALRQATSMSERAFADAMTLFTTLNWYQARYTLSLLQEKKIAAGDKFRVARNKLRTLDKEWKARKKGSDAKKEKAAKEAYETKRASLLNVNKQALEALQDAVENYRIALTAKPGSAFDKLAEAHAALTASLNSSRPEFKAVFAFVQQAADAAAQIAKDAKAIDKALNSKAKA